MVPSRKSLNSAALVPRPHRVKRVQRELRDTVTLELEPLDPGQEAFLPGQFNMLYRMSVGEVPISMSGSPLATSTLVHTVRAVGAVTRAICSSKRGDVVGVRGPFGRGWPMEAADGKDVLIVAGGIGLAPLRPVIYQILARRQRYGRVALLVGARSPVDLLFAAELEHWRFRADLDVQTTVDTATEGWIGHVGVVTSLLTSARFEPRETIAMLCGPEIMMRFGAAEVLRRGVAPEDIYLSMERNMQCAVGICGHCQYGPAFVCKDGPVFAFPQVERLLNIREV